LNLLSKEILQINEYLNDESFYNYHKLNGIKYSLNFIHSYERMPYIYVVTPTYSRPNQMAELTRYIIFQGVFCVFFSILKFKIPKNKQRLANTLRIVPKVIWLIVEDAEIQSQYLLNFLKSSKINFIHLHVSVDQLITFETLKHNVDDLDKSGYNLHRGSAQRNTAIDWLRNNFNLVKENSVIYFADDDNTYSIRLFEEVFIILHLS
jgi:hypothetical protein